MIAFDVHQKLREFVVELFALESGQALEAHVEYRLGLDFRELKLRNEVVPRGRHVGRASDYRDYAVYRVERSKQPLYDVTPVLGLAQAELRPAAHHLAAVVEEYQHHILERQLLRSAVDDGEIYDAEGRLKLRARIELAQHEVRVGVALELDDYAHAVSVGFVAQV